MKGNCKGNGKGKSSNKKEAEVDENDDPNKEKSKTRPCPNELTGEKSVDWSLINIWCCGKFFSIDYIAAHAELCHAVAVSSYEDTRCKTGPRRRSSLFLPHTGGSFRPGVLQDESAEVPPKFRNSTELSAEEGQIMSTVTQAEYWCKKRKGNGKVTNKALDETNDSKLLSFKKRKSKEFTSSLLMRKPEKVRNRVKVERQGRKKTLGNGSVSKTFHVKIEVEEMEVNLVHEVKNMNAEYIDAEGIVSPNEPKKERQYFCDKCDYVGNFQHALQRHVEAAHQGIRYKCSQCDFTTGYQYNLNSHMKAKHLLIKFTCDKCKYTCTERRLLKNHKNAVHDKDKVHACSQCSFTSGYQYNLTAHVKTKHQPVFFPCYLCDYTGTCKRNLNSHVKTHHQGQRFPCPLCNASFGFKYNLNAHIKKKCPRRQQS